MIPTSFNGENGVYYPEPEYLEEIHVMPVLMTETVKGAVPCCVSCWKMTKEEVETFNREGKIWLVMAVANVTEIPYIRLEANRPFEIPKHLDQLPPVDDLEALRHDMLIVCDMYQKLGDRIKALAVRLEPCLSGRMEKERDKGKGRDRNK